MSTSLYLDTINGISGDMFVGLMIDLGVDREWLIGELKRMSIHHEFEIKVINSYKNGIYGTKFNVLEHSGSDHPLHHHHAHGRHLKEIIEIIKSAGYTEKVEQCAISIFTNLGMAESKIHNKSINEIHFHEVGAVDSIVDIVAAALCIEKLDIQRVYASPVPVGSGHVKCDHGLMPVPAPATLELLKDVPIYDNGSKGEIVTPTGAAILKTIVDDFKAMDFNKIQKIGYGLGTKEFEIANVVRGLLYTDENTFKQEEIICLMTNIDDMTGEDLSYTLEKLMESGALDVTLTPVIMKKGRPGQILTVLCRLEDEKMMLGILFKETTAIGVRRQKIQRVVLSRESSQTSTDFGIIESKWVGKGTEFEEIYPEFDSLKKTAIENEISMKQIRRSFLGGLR